MNKDYNKDYNKEIEKTFNNFIHALEDNKSRKEINPNRVFDSLNEFEQTIKDIKKDISERIKHSNKRQKFKF